VQTYHFFPNNSFLFKLKIFFKINAGQITKYLLLNKYTNLLKNNEVKDPRQAKRFCLMQFTVLMKEQQQKGT